MTTPPSSTSLDAAQEEATLAVVVRYASAFVGALSERQLWDAIARAVRGVAFKDGASVKRHCEWLLRVKRQQEYKAHEQLTEKIKELLDKVEALGVCTVEDREEEEKTQGETTKAVETTTLVEPTVVETAVAVESDAVDVVQMVAEEVQEEGGGDASTSEDGVAALTTTEGGIVKVVEVVGVAEENEATREPQVVVAPTASEAEAETVIELMESDDDDDLTVEELRAAARRQAERKHTVSEAGTEASVEVVESEDDDLTIEELRAAARRRAQPSVSAEAGREGIPNPKPRSPTPSVEKAESKSPLNDQQREGRLQIDVEVDVSTATALPSLPTSDHDEELMLDEDDAQVRVLASTSVAGDGDEPEKTTPPTPDRWKSKAERHQEQVRIVVDRDERFMRVMMALRPFATFASAEATRRNNAVREAAKHPMCTSAMRMSGRLQHLVHVYERPEQEEHGLLTPTLRELIGDYVKAKRYAQRRQDFYKKLPKLMKTQLKDFEDGSHDHEPSHEPTTLDDEVLLTETLDTNPFTGYMKMSRVLWVHVAASVQRKDPESPFHTGRECMARVERLLSVVRDTSHPFGLRVPSSQVEMLKLLHIFHIQSQPGVDFDTLRALPFFVTTMAQAKLLTAEKSTGGSPKQQQQRGRTASLIASQQTSDDDEDVEDVFVEGVSLLRATEVLPNASPAQMDVRSPVSAMTIADADAVNGMTTRRTLSLSEERLKVDVVRDEQFLRLTMELRPFATFHPEERLRRKKKILEIMDHPNYATANLLNGRLRRLVRVYEDPAHHENHLLTPQLGQLIADYNACWKHMLEQLEFHKALPAVSESDLEEFEDDSHAYEPSHEPTTADDQELLAETVKINPFTGVVSMTRVLWVYVASVLHGKLKSKSPFRTGRQCIDRVEKLLTVVRDERNPHGLMVPRDQLEMLKLIDVMGKRSQRDVDLETLRSLPPCTTTVVQAVARPLFRLVSGPTIVSSASIKKKSRQEKEKLERKNQTAKKNERLTVDVERDERMMRLALERIKAVNSPDMAVRLAGVCEAMDHPHYATTHMVHTRIRWLHDALKLPQGKLHSQLTPTLRQRITEYREIWKQQQDARTKIPSIPAIEVEAFNDHSHAHEPLHPPTMLEDEVLLTEIMEVSPFDENIAMTRVLWVRVAANVQSKLNYNSPYRTGRACMARLEQLLSVVRDERNPLRRTIDGYQLEMLRVIDVRFSASALPTAASDAGNVTLPPRTTPTTKQEMTKEQADERLKVDVVLDKRFLRLMMELRPFATFHAGERQRRYGVIRQSMDHPKYSTAAIVSNRLSRLVRVYEDPKHDDHHVLTPQLRQLIADYNTCWKHRLQQLEMYKTLPALSETDLKAFEDNSHAHEPSHEPTTADDQELLAETVKINPFTGHDKMTRTLWVHVASYVRKKLVAGSPFRTGRQCMDRVEKLLTVARDERNPHGLIVPRDQLETLKLIDVMDKRSQRDVDLETLRSLPPCTTTVAQAVFQPLSRLEPTPVSSSKSRIRKKLVERLTVDVERDERMMRLALERIKAVNSPDVAVRLGGISEAMDHPYYATTYMVSNRIRWLHDAFKRPQGKLHSQLTPTLRQLITEYRKIWTEQQDARKKIPSIPAIEVEAFNDHSHAHEPLHPPTMLEDEALLTEIMEVSPFDENIAMARVLWVRVAANVQSKLNYNSPYRTGRACMARLEQLLNVVRDERNPLRRTIDGYQLEMLRVIDILDKQTRAAADSGQTTSSSSSVDVVAEASPKPVASKQVPEHRKPRRQPQHGSLASFLASIPSPPTSDDDGDAEMEDQSEEELLDFVGISSATPSSTLSSASVNADEAPERPTSGFSRAREAATSRPQSEENEVIVLSDSDSSSDEHDVRPQDGHRYRRAERTPEFVTPMMASHNIPSVRGGKRKDRADETLRPSKAAKTSTVRSPRRVSTSESSQLREMREEIAMLRAHITAREQAHEMEIRTLSTMLKDEQQAYRRSRTELVEVFEGERDERRDDFMQMMSVVTKAVLPPLPR